MDCLEGTTNMARRAAVDDAGSRDTIAAKAGMALRATMPFVYDGYLYFRGSRVPETVLASANGGTFLSRRIVEWIPADAPVGVAPRKLPEPEPPMEQGPSLVQVAELAKATNGTLGDAVAEWLAAVDAVEKLLDPREAWRARDFLRATRPGSDLFLRAQGTDAKRVARANKMVGRRPVRPL
jgi:hypothetical protein